MRIIIAGGRDFNDYKLLEDSCNKIFHQLAKEGYFSLWVDKSHPEIVCGKANGADTLGERFAKEYNLGIKEFPADWNNLNTQPCKIKFNKFGNAYNALAGHNRNLQMALYAKEDNGALIAFHDGKSTGTKNMINLANKHGLKVFVINY